MIFIKISFILIIELFKGDPMGYSTKQQHYIPQMILKRFYADDYARDDKNKKNKYLWAYDKEKNKEYKIFKLKEICKRRNLYELKKYNNIIEGTNNEIEKYLAKLELIWSKIFDKIENGNLDLSIDEIASIYHFVTIQMLRLPEIMKTNTYLITKQIEVELKQNNCKKINSELADAFAKFNALYPYDMNDENDRRLHWMFENVFLELAKKDLTIIHSSDTFILNDENPFVVEFVSDMVKGGILFPFSKKYAIFLENNADSDSIEFKGIKDIDRDSTKQINLAIAKRGRFLYSAKKISSVMSYNELTKIQNKI